MELGGVNVYNSPALVAREPARGARYVRGPVLDASRTASIAAMKPSM
jgi:hypothetical protein